MNRPRIRRIPNDFVAHALAHKVKETRAYYRIGNETYQRWAIESGIYETISARSKTGAPPRPAPDDFAIHGVHESTAELRQRYGVSAALITRWRKLTGVAPDLRRIAIPADFASRAACMSMVDAARHYGVGESTIKRWRQETGVKLKRWGGWAFHRAAPTKIHLADDLAGRAQRYLQHIGPVFKQGGGFSVFGRRMSADEMVAFARAKGFQPDEWRKVA